MAAVGGGHFPVLTRDVSRRAHSRDHDDATPRRMEPMWMLLALAAFSWSLVLLVAAAIEQLL